MFLILRAEDGTNAYPLVRPKLSGKTVNIGISWFKNTNMVKDIAFKDIRDW